MRILFVCEYYRPHIGGVELVFERLAGGLARRGHLCDVVTCRLPGTPAYEEIDHVRVHRVRVPRSGDRYWFTALALGKVLQLARKADLIHTTTFNGAFPAWLASKVLRRKCVVTVHEVWGPMWKIMGNMNIVSARLHQFVERAILALPFDRYACPSSYTRDRLRAYGIRAGKSVVVHNGIDLDIFDPGKADGDRVRRDLGLGDAFVYLYYGRPGTSKGMEYLVRAVPMIRQRIPNSRLLLILSHKPEDGYKNTLRLISDLGIDGTVSLLDALPGPDLVDYIAAADCVVVPSLSEGFSLTTAEACAMDRPVVASNVTAIPEVISGRYVLVEPRSAEAIAEGVGRVYSGTVEVAERKEFSWDRCIDGYLELYSDTVCMR